MRPSIFLPVLLSMGCAHHQLTAYPLHYEDAASAAATMQALDLRGIRVAVPVERTNQVVVNATPAGQVQVAELLTVIDLDASIDERPQVLVIYLLEHRAEALAPSLQGLWDQGELRLGADARANAIIARGERAALHELQAVVERLDLSEEALVPPEPEASTTVE